MSCLSCHADNEPTARFCFACGAPLDPTLAGLAEGVVFASRYEILAPLGRGGMGMVYKAFDHELGEAVAIKVLRPDLARESGRVEQRFRSEIRLARRVRHRNVCSVYGDGVDRGLLYICMELVEGENLARAAREGVGLPPDEAWSAVLQVADGLSAIHEVGIVHRDLKTANLMRDRHGVVKVMDFGIAKQHGAAGGGATVTATGTLMGTPEYMSPEQLRGEEVGFRSDLYSFGIVVYELFSGTVPFRGDTPVATIVRQLQDSAFLDLPSLPDPLRPVLARALAKAAADRYATADEMHDALESACRVSAPGATALHAEAHGSADDETRPVVAGAWLRGGSLARIAVAQAAVAALAVHLVSAGGARPAWFPLPPPVPVAATAAPAPAPTPTPSPVEPSPVVTVQARAVRRPPAPLATPVPTPIPLGAVALPDVEPPPAPLAVARPADPSRVYDEDEVEVRPRRLAGTTAPYPEWGPKLPKGRSVSITASYVVTEEGLVTDIRVERGGGVLEAVLLEISRWRFEPGTIGGVPVKVRVHWKHTFIGG